MVIPQLQRQFLYELSRVSRGMRWHYSKTDNNETDIMVNIIRGKETYMVLAENISKNSGPKIRTLPR